MELAAPTNRCAQAIAKNKILEIKHALGITIACLAGSIWITLDNDIRDMILHAGHSFKVKSNQRVLIQALDTAHINFIDPS
jgi:Protein of unknown function (DUF2917)